jgi:GDPmannose 4,6-dehydratase
MSILITGVNSQDGSYLAEFLLSKKQEVHGTLRRTTNKNLDYIRGLDIKIHWATLENYASLYKVIQTVKPAEVYHLAAQSFVTNSFEDEFSTMSTNIHGTHYMLNACKEIVPNVKFYFAGSSEMFGNQPSPQSEATQMTPVSPYGISKLAGYNLCKYYRSAFDMFICTGIMFNHESPRRGKEFVTQKICQTAKRRERVALGNLEAKRDWGYAKDYVEAMWMMLQGALPLDYVIATGETHSVREFVKLAYGYVGLNYEDYVIIDQDLYRPNELNELRGDSRFALGCLGWKHKTNFEQLVELMMR